MEGCFTFQWGVGGLFFRWRGFIFGWAVGAPNAGFSLLGDGGSPPTTKVNPPLRPTKQQFSSYNPIKTAFLAVLIATAPVIENNKKIILMIISII